MATPFRPIKTLDYVLGTGLQNALLSLVPTSITFPDGIVPVIKQANKTTNSGTGAVLTLQAQNEAGTSSVGGALVLQSGTGTSTDGAISLKTGSTARLSLSSGNITVQASTLLTTTGSGNINLPNNGSSKFQIEGVAVGASVTSSNLLTLTNNGDASALHTHSGVAGSFTDLTATGNTVLGNATSDTISTTAQLITDLTVASTVTNFNFSQADKTTNSATGANLTIHAQNETGTTSNGGDLVLSAGTGTATHGRISLNAGSVTAFFASETNTILSYNDGISLIYGIADGSIAVGDGADTSSLTLQSGGSTSIGYNGGRNLIIGNADDSIEIGTLATTTDITIACSSNMILTGTTDITLAAGGAEKFKANSTGIGFNAATPIARPDYTVTNPSASRSLDVGAATLAQLRAVVGTMIADLILYGLYQ